MPTGSVIQTVTATASGQQTNTTSTFAATGLTATITPTSATSKILIFANIAGVEKSGGNAYAGFVLVRNGSGIFTYEGELLYNGVSQTNAGSVGTTYLDSPATTSATTYSVSFKNGNNGVGTVAIQTTGGISTITLLEIKQ